MTRTFPSRAVVKSVEAQFAPWSAAVEDQAVATWRAVKSLTHELARQEPQAITEMIEHLQALKDGRHG